MFPLAPGGNQPAIRDWPTRATTDMGMIEEWWSWRFPNAPVAIATGRASGIWVLDLDVKDGLNGISDWADLVIEHGAGPDTFTVMSRSGGSHLYYAWNDAEPIRNSAKRIGPGIDVRGEGGYVRALTRQKDIISYTVPQQAPGWLVKLAVEAGSPRGGGRSGSGSRPVEWTDASESLKHAAVRLKRVETGGRNDALNRAAFLLARWSGETGVDESEAWLHLAWACKRNGLWADDGPEGCRATFVSGWTAGHAIASDGEAE